VNGAYGQASTRQITCEPFPSLGFIVEDELVGINGKAGVAGLAAALESGVRVSREIRKSEGT